MTLAGCVLNQDDLASANHSLLTVACGYLHACIEIDNVLPARGRMPSTKAGGREGIPFPSGPYWHPVTMTLGIPPKGFGKEIGLQLLLGGDVG